MEAIRALYINTSPTIITPDDPTEFFNISAGVLQGDTLAPLLFIIALDYALRLSLEKINDKGLTIQPRRSSRYPSKHLTDLDFVYDIALLADCLENAQHMLTSLQEAADLVGLHLNEGKTEYITNCSGNAINAQNDSDIRSRTLNI